MRYAIPLLLFIVPGCSGKAFTEVGNGMGVPVGTIENYAEEHGVSEAEARARLQTEARSRRVEDHAAKYGVTMEEARGQLEHAASQQAHNQR